MKKYFLFCITLIISSCFYYIAVADLDISIKTQKLIHKDFLISQKKLQNYSNGDIYISELDKIVWKLSDEKLLKVYIKLENVNISWSKEVFNKYLYMYIQSIIGIELYNRNLEADIDSSIVKNEDTTNVISDYFIENIWELRKNSISDKELAKNLKLFANEKLSLNEKILLDFYLASVEGGQQLNYQDFEAWKKIYSNYLSSNIDNLEFIAKNSDYLLFVAFTQSSSFLDISSTSVLMEYRDKYFPEEKNTAFNKTRKHWYKGIVCEDLIIKDVDTDLVPYNFCKLFNKQFEEQDLYDLQKLSQNIQNYSDMWNYISYIYSASWENRDILELKKQYGKIVIEWDKNFVNWYLLILDYYSKTNNCESIEIYKQLLEDNYIWSASRKIDINKSIEAYSCDNN